MPSAARRAGPSRDMSAPAKRIAPESGFSSPESWPIRVVLPAPLGPITAWISPGAMDRETSPVATRPPKRFVRPAVSSSASATAPPRERKDPVEPGLREQHDQDQDRSKHRLPMLGQARQNAFEDQVSSGAKPRPDQGAEPAEDHHHHDLAGTGPMHDRWRDKQGQIGEERTGDTADRTRHDKGGQLIAEGREAERDHPTLVGFDALQQHAEARLHDPIAEKQKQQQQAVGEVVEDDRAVEIERGAKIAVPRDVEPIVAAILVEPDTDELHHLAERQGDHDEIDTGSAQRHETDDQRRYGSGKKRRREMHDAVGYAVIAQDAHGISADAEIGGVTKADKPAIAEDQVETDRGDREHDDASEKPDVEGRLGHCRDRRNQRQRGERDTDRDMSDAQ